MIDEKQLGEIDRIRQKISIMDLRWFSIIFISSYVALKGISLVLRPESPTNIYIINRFGLQPESLAFVLFLLVPLIPLVYYFFKSFFHVMVALVPLLAIKGILIYQILGSPTAPLEHLLAHITIPVCFFWVFIVLERLQVERDANQILAQKNQKLHEELLRKTGNDS